eukprot:GDKK01063109.1.p1 GENE.GDKK01063109.1~~GDKK01063109.1.p1  ORF type:complete len:221 (+),score=79.34 GDKK01063109.1:79-741(+)
MLHHFLFFLFPHCQQQQQQQTFFQSTSHTLASHFSPSFINRPPTLENLLSPPSNNPSLFPLVEEGTTSDRPPPASEPYLPSLHLHNNNNNFSMDDAIFHQQNAHHQHAHAAHNMPTAWVHCASSSLPPHILLVPPPSPSQQQQQLSSSFSGCDESPLLIPINNNNNCNNHVLMINRSRSAHRPLHHVQSSSGSGESEAAILHYKQYINNTLMQFDADFTV